MYLHLKITIKCVANMLIPISVAVSDGGKKTVNHTPIPRTTEDDEQELVLLTDIANERVPNLESKVVGFSVTSRKNRLVAIYFLREH
jgi:hypothetical protein